MSDFRYSGIVLKSSERLELDSHLYVIRILSILIPKEMKNLNFSPKGPRTETLFIANHENVKKSTFDWLAAKL